MRASQQKIMLAGAGAFMLLSSSLTLLEQSLIQHPAAVQEASPKQLSHRALIGSPVPIKAVKVGQISASIQDVHADAAEAIRMIERYNGMLLGPGKQFVLELPDGKPLRFDNTSSEPVLIKSWVSYGQANLVFYKGVSCPSHLDGLLFFSFLYFG